ncbi:ATP-binding cassette domain-containing protein [Kocuria rhizophila]|nr:ATP-binding cassette domain-containing protein [Kocuria rhizophila]
MLGLDGAGRATLLRMLAGQAEPDAGEVVAGHGLKLATSPGARHPGHGPHSAGDVKSAAPDLADAQVRTILGSFLFQGDDVDKPAGVLSGGEERRLALATLVACVGGACCCWTSHRRPGPASRHEILNALRDPGAVVLVSHDEGAVEALEPERVVMLPDGVEDLWSQEYQDLISLA